MTEPQRSVPTEDRLLGAYRMLRPNIDAGRSLVVIGSTDVSAAYYRVLCHAAAALDVEVTIGLMTPRDAPGQPIPPALLTHAREADTVLFTGSASVAHSRTALELLAAGKRIITFPVPAETPGSTDAACESLAQLAIYDQGRLDELKHRCAEIAAILDTGSRVRVTSPSGTDLTLSIAGRRTHSWYGTCDEDSHGITAWPPGEAHIAVVEDSANGVAVMDGYISGIGAPDEPLELEFVDGSMTSFRGGAASQLADLLGIGGARANVFCELGVAVNPWLEVTGSNGDKNALGTWHFALGTNASACFGGTEFDGTNHSGLHLDLVSTGPTTIAVDDTVIPILEPPARSD